MSNCFTKRSKFPRTVNLQTYPHWTEEVCKWREPEPALYTPHQHLWPLPPHKRFRPFPAPTTQWDPPPDREGYWGVREGLKTPEQSIHLGYKQFIHDPFSRKLREVAAEKPLPYTLNTEIREQFQNPKRRPHLIFQPQNYERYGNPVDRRCSIGAAPRILSIPPVGRYYPDASWWKRDCNT